MYDRSMFVIFIKVLFSLLLKVRKIDLRYFAHCNQN